MSEDEFELVAVFEKVTHEKTELLHHVSLLPNLGSGEWLTNRSRGLEQGSPFPPFTDYQDTFSVPLQPDLFVLYGVPNRVSRSPQLHRLAKALYPCWRERRSEQGGHPIIPVVNVSTPCRDVSLYTDSNSSQLDETDTLSESYVCFRRREIKAVRKTRAQQATYSDEMVRLQSELSTAAELVKGVVQRELAKKEVTVHGQALWDKRFGLMDLKRKFPALGSKEDDELFFDKERVSKKAKTDSTYVVILCCITKHSLITLSSRLPLKFRQNGEYSPIPQELVMKPKGRQQLIQKQIDQEFAAHEAQDHSRAIPSQLVSQTQQSPTRQP